MRGQRRYSSQYKSEKRKECERKVEQGKAAIAAKTRAKNVERGNTDGELTWNNMPKDILEKIFRQGGFTCAAPAMMVCSYWHDCALPVVDELNPIKTRFVEECSFYDVDEREFTCIQSQLEKVLLVKSEEIKAAKAPFKKIERSLGYGHYHVFNVSDAVDALFAPPTDEAEVNSGNWGLIAFAIRLFQKKEEKEIKKMEKVLLTDKQSILRRRALVLAFEHLDIPMNKLDSSKNAKILEWLSKGEEKSSLSLFALLQTLKPRETSVLLFQEACSKVTTKLEELKADWKKGKEAFLMSRYDHGSLPPPKKLLKTLQAAAPPKNARRSPFLKQIGFVKEEEEDEDEGKEEKEKHSNSLETKIFGKTKSERQSQQRPQRSIDVVVKDEEEQQRRRSKKNPTSKRKKPASPPPPLIISPIKTSNSGRRVRKAARYR
jgi:hypothetical protein